MNSPHELALLIDALCTLHGEPQPRAALATLTRTRGSTFRRPGTHMLVHEDGRVVCELSGGCPQRDIERQALEAIARGQPRRIRYNSESGLDVLIEMGCGGELEVLVEPLPSPGAIDFAGELARCLASRESARLATLFAVDDQVIVPRRLLWSDAQVRFDGTGDAVLGDAMAAACAGWPGRGAGTLQLPSRLGRLDVLVEAVEPPHALVVIGSSAAARALLPLSTALGWRTTLVDHDPERLRRHEPLPGLRTVCTVPERLRDALPLDRHTSVVVMTHNLELDITWLAALRGVPVAYAGALGSRERVARMRGAQALAGLRLHAPAGLDIGSETPEEIALAVAAEIMAVLNGRDGGPLRDNDGAIHG
ncbi:MAG: XdhC family protein [Pseudomonadota bacterium]